MLTARPYCEISTNPLSLINVLEIIDINVDKCLGSGWGYLLLIVMGLVSRLLLNFRLNVSESFH